MKIVLQWQRSSKKQLGSRECTLNNLQPVDHQSDALTIALPSLNSIESTGAKPLACGGIFCGRFVENLLLNVPEFFEN